MMLFKRDLPLLFRPPAAEGRPLMTSQFDASFAYTGQISAEVQAAHASEIEHSMMMPSKLANAKLHANNELRRWTLACNRLVWDGMPADARRPAQDEIAALLEQLSPENRDRLLKESQLAAEARNLVALLSAAEVEAHALLEAKRAEEERAEAQRALREQFEAFDAAGKEARFHAWLAER
jgi:hypothetical protein